MYNRQIQQFFGVQIITDEFTVHTDINHVERMDAVLIVDVDALIDICLLYTSYVPE